MSTSTFTHIRTQLWAASVWTAPRLPRRYGPALFSLIMSTAICAVTSSMITAINTGFDAHYLERWLRAYLLAWSFAFPTVMVVGPRVRRFVEAMVVTA